jgi:hypothetical protein
VELYFNSPNTPPRRGAQLKHRDNFTFHLREIGWEGVEWMHLAQGRWQALVNTVMNFHVPKTGNNLTC